MKKSILISLGFILFIFIISLVDKYIFNYNPAIVILMFVALVIYVVYLLKQTSLEKKNLDRKMYIAKIESLIVFTIIILLIIFRSFIMKFIEPALFYSILIGLVAALIFALSSIFIMKKIIKFS